MITNLNASGGRGGSVKKKTFGIITHTYTQMRELKDKVSLRENLKR